MKHVRRQHSEHMYQEALNTAVMENLINQIQNKHCSQTLSDIKWSPKDFYEKKVNL